MMFSIILRNGYRNVMQSQSFAAATLPIVVVGGNYRMRTFFTKSAPAKKEIIQHFRISQKLEEKQKPAAVDSDENPMLHPIWSREELHGVTLDHKTPVELHEKLAHVTIQCVRICFDVFSGYAFGKPSEAKLLRRIIFLETVAGIPGMLAATLRHLRSLRRIERDRGWIYSLLSEAENERMHMLMFSELQQPGPFFRLLVLAAQGIMWNWFFVAYLINPRFCHSFVGYLEEEACKTYTHAIRDVDAGHLPNWQTMPAPATAKKYWHLPDGATMRDVLLCVRCDESWHRDTNHKLSELERDDVNPFAEH